MRTSGGPILSDPDERAAQIRATSSLRPGRSPALELLQHGRTSGPIGTLRGRDSIEQASTSRSATAGQSAGQHLTADEASTSISALRLRVGDRVWPCYMCRPAVRRKYWLLTCCPAVVY
jgi:hypothetical protein